jgi:hypothetical protein
MAEWEWGNHRLNGGCLGNWRRRWRPGPVGRSCLDAGVAKGSHSRVQCVLGIRTSHREFRLRSSLKRMGTVSGRGRVRDIAGIGAIEGRGCFDACSKRRSEHTANVVSWSSFDVIS